MTDRHPTRVYGDSLLPSPSPTTVTTTVTVTSTVTTVEGKYFGPAVADDRTRTVRATEEAESSGYFHGDRDVYSFVRASLLLWKRCHRSQVLRHPGPGRVRPEALRHPGPGRGSDSRSHVQLRPDTGRKLWGPDPGSSTPSTTLGCPSTVHPYVKGQESSFVGSHEYSSEVHEFTTVG